MKIAIISFYNGLIARGVESWAEEIAAHLSNSNELTIFQNGKEEKRSSKYKVVSENILVDPKQKDSRNTIRRLFFIDYWSVLIARFTFKIIPTLWKEDFDVYIPTNGGWQSVLIRFLSWFKGSKMVIIGHSGRGLDDRINLWTFPDTFVALTKNASEWAKGVNPLVRVEHIPNGIDLKKFTERGTKLNIKFKHPVILCVGALNLTKRIDLVIRAVSCIPEVDLLVVGVGDSKKEIQELGEELLKNRFYLINVSYEKMPEVYRLANVFTLVSWSREAFPLVYLEAMASNLPVVASDDLIRQEIIGEAGILVDPENQEKYIEALKAALEKDWGDKPRKQAEIFSWDVIAQEYENLFTSLIK